MKNFIRENWFKLVIALVLLLITISIGYYYLIFLPQKENLRIEIEKQNELIKKATENQKHLETVKNNCIDSVLKEMKSENPNMETNDITNFRIANDRGCFIESGCMNGVQDVNFKSKFDECNEEYYNSCLDTLKKQIDEMIETEKTKRIDECIALYIN